MLVAKKEDFATLMVDAIMEQRNVTLYCEPVTFISLTTVDNRFFVLVLSSEGESVSVSLLHGVSYSVEDVTAYVHQLSGELIRRMGKKR